jgi:hypothetical protein
MSFGRLWQHAKYSYGVWQLFAHQASTILGIVFSDTKSKSENMVANVRVWDPKSRQDLCLPARKTAKIGGMGEEELDLALAPLPKSWSVEHI